MFPSHFFTNLFDIATLVLSLEKNRSKRDSWVYSRITITWAVKLLLYSFWRPSACHIIKHYPMFLVRCFMCRQVDNKIFLNQVEFSTRMWHMCYIKVKFLSCPIFLDIVEIYFLNEDMCTCVCVRVKLCVSMAAWKHEGIRLGRQQGREVLL